MQRISDMQAELAAEVSPLRHACFFTTRASLPSLKKDDVTSRNQPENDASPATRIE